MIPACPNNLLLMALVFWCAAHGATIDEAVFGPPNKNESTRGFYSLTFRPRHPKAGFGPPNKNESTREPRLLTSRPRHPKAGFGPPNKNESIREPRLLTSRPRHPSGPRSLTFRSPHPNSKGQVTVVRSRVSEVAQMFLTSPMSTIIIPSFYTAVFLLSVPANTCALLVFLRRIKPLDPAVIYMLNLAFADLLFAMVLPFKIFYHFKGNYWTFGETMCRVVTAAFEWNMYCSVLLITLISVDRLLSVVYPMTSQSWRSPRKAFLACGATWILSFAGSMHYLFTKQTSEDNDLNITTCHDIQPSDPMFWEKTYYITLCLLLIFLPLIITVVSYTRVIITLNKDQPGVPDPSGRKRRAAMLTTTVLVMFVLCFMPTNIILIIHQVMFTEKQVPENHLHPDQLYVVYLVFLCLGSMNCVLDPLVYYIGSTKFQKEVCSIFQRRPNRAPAQARPNLVKAIQSMLPSKQIQNLFGRKLQMSSFSNSGSTKPTLCTDDF